MANICSNTITFTGTDLSIIRKAITEIESKHKEGEGWLPDGFIGSYLHYLFDVDVQDYETDIVFNCWTKWAPPIEEMLHLCKGANINIELQYEEMGCQLYGVYHYDYATDTLSDTCLDYNDFARVVYDDDNDEYTFDGEPIESDSEAYEEILEEKLKQLTF
jgi:hypothetical protein